MSLFVCFGRDTKKRPPFPLQTNFVLTRGTIKNFGKATAKKRCYCCRKVDKIGRGCSPMKTKRARRGRAFDRMPCGVVKTMFICTAKVRTLFGTAKRFRLLFCRRSHFDNECHSECAFLAAFWPYSNGLSLNVLRGSPRLSSAKRLPSWTLLGRIRQKAPCFRWKVGGFLGKGVGFWEIIGSCLCPCL